LEQLDRVTRRVFDNRLSAADAFDHVAAEGDARTTELRRRCGDVAYLNGEAIPATRLWRTAVRERRPAADVLTSGGAQYQPKVATGQHGKRRGGVHVLVKAEVTGVEGDGVIDIVDDVADLD
jgi:hypothetical protein